MSLFKDVTVNSTKNAENDIASAYSEYVGVKKDAIPYRVADRFNKLPKFSKVLIILLMISCSGIIAEDAFSCWRGQRGFVRRVVHQVRYNRGQRVARRNARRGNYVVYATPDSAPLTSPLPEPEEATLRPPEIEPGSTSTLSPEPNVVPEIPRDDDPFKEKETESPKIPAPKSGEDFFEKKASSKRIKAIFVKIERSPEDIARERRDQEWLDTCFRIVTPFFEIPQNIEEATQYASDKLAALKLRNEIVH